MDEYKKKNKTKYDTFFVIADIIIIMITICLKR